MWGELIGRLSALLGRAVLPKNEHYVMMVGSRLDNAAINLHKLIFMSPLQAQSIKELPFELEYCAFMIWMFQLHARRKIEERGFSFVNVAQQYVERHLHRTQNTTGIKSPTETAEKLMNWTMGLVDEYQRIYDANPQNGFELALDKFLDRYCKEMSGPDRGLFGYEFGEVFQTVFKQIFPREIAAVDRRWGGVRASGSGTPTSV